MIRKVKKARRDLNRYRYQAYKEYRRYIRSVAGKPVVQRMKKYEHHGDTSCFKHSLHVSFMNYIICKRLGLDKEAAARAGMLHDLFLYDWHTYRPRRGERLHGFEHPSKALRNAHRHFKLSSKEGDMIARHMFPLTLTLPKYKETVVIIATDKLASIGEVLDQFFRK